jgi:DNA-binding PadR family transcriptional regulator
MMEDIAAFAGTRLGAGTLYGALTRLETHGLVEALPAAQRRHPYRLTTAGTALPRARLGTLDTYPAIARTRLVAS